MARWSAAQPGQFVRTEDVVGKIAVSPHENQRHALAEVVLQPAADAGVRVFSLPSYFVKAVLLLTFVEDLEVLACIHQPLIGRSLAWSRLSRRRFRTRRRRGR